MKEANSRVGIANEGVISVECEPYLMYLVIYLSGPYWDRTSDPHNVNVVLYR
jgi:hypothetical protein